jgi:DNA-binding IclR family transcriptional regulator
VLLAYQAADWREHYVKSANMVSPVTGASIGKAWLRQELKRIREERLAVSRGEAVPGASGIAAPILLPDGDATHALLIAAPADRFERALPGLRRLISEVAANASAALRDFRG